MSTSPITANLSPAAGAYAAHPASVTAGAANVACPTATALAAFLSGALQSALGRAPAVGDVFILTSAQDTSDAAFQAAKGSAPAVNDAFVVTGLGATVAYVAPVVVVSDAFAAIAAYLSNPPNTVQARSASIQAIQKFNELVALVNAVAA